MFSTYAFHALGSEIEICIASSGDFSELFSQIKLSAQEFESRFSRFKDDSELCKFNRYEGREFKSSREFADLMLAAQYYHKITDGIFNPTIIDRLESFYDRSFEKIGLEKAGRTTPSPSMGRRGRTGSPPFKGGARGGFNGIRIDDRIISKPKDLRVDFGGIGKGYLADQLVKILDKLEADYWISLGGDLFLSSKFRVADWSLGVQNPQAQDDDLLHLKLKSTRVAAATSGITKRAGAARGIKWNHIIDPRTGKPVDNDLLSVTALASTVVQADVFAKTVLILGKEDGFKFIEKQASCTCLVIDKQLNYHTLKGFESFAEII